MIINQELMSTISNTLDAIQDKIVPIFGILSIILIIVYIIMKKELFTSFKITGQEKQAFEAICYINIIITLNLLVSNIPKQTIIFNMISLISIILTIILCTLFTYEILDIVKKQYPNLITEKQNSDQHTIEKQNLKNIIKKTLVYTILPILLFANLIYIMFSMIVFREFLFFSNVNTIISVLSCLLLGIIALKIKSKIWLTTISIMMSILMFIQFMYSASYTKVSDKD